MAKQSAKSTTRRASAKAPAKKAKSAKKSSVQRQSTTVTTVSYNPILALLERFRPHTVIKHPVRLPSVWQLTKKTSLILWENRIIFLGIVAWYAVLSFIFVQNTNGSANNLKSTLDHVGAGNLGDIASSFGAFAVLASSTANTASPTAGFYQFVFAVITTLAVIWVVRQRASGTKVRIRDAYYRGMYPIIPFILVLLVICVQLLPLAIGAALYATVMNGGIAVHFIEQVFWSLLFLGLALWSLYMVTATVFALYIVSLPDMAPIEAIRSARKLVHHRRLIVLRKIIYMPLVLLLIAAILMLPVILVAVSLAPAILSLLSMAGLVAANTYMYSLYRELVNE
jgi:hypothetical protein